MDIQKMEGQSKAEIAKALPCAIKTALASYQRFAADEDIGDAKEFKAHHDACKVAIAHIELLLKLADSVKAEQAGDASGAVDPALMGQLIESAREVRLYEDTQSKKGRKRNRRFHPKPKREGA